jgi:hypothetical protein
MVRTSQLAARLLALRTRTKWKKVYRKIKMFDATAAGSGAARTCGLRACGIDGYPGIMYGKVIGLVVYRSLSILGPCLIAWSHGL